VEAVVFDKQRALGSKDLKLNSDTVNVTEMVIVKGAVGTITLGQNLEAFFLISVLVCVRLHVSVAVLEQDCGAQTSLIDLLGHHVGAISLRPEGVPIEYQVGVPGGRIAIEKDARHGTSI